MKAHFPRKISFSFKTYETDDSICAPDSVEKMSQTLFFHQKRLSCVLAVKKPWRADISNFAFLMKFYVLKGINRSKKHWDKNSRPETSKIEQLRNKCFTKQLNPLTDLFKH